MAEKGFIRDEFHNLFILSVFINEWQYFIYLKFQSFKFKEIEWNANAKCLFYECGMCPFFGAQIDFLLKFYFIGWANRNSICENELQHKFLFGIRTYVWNIVMGIFLGIFLVKLTHKMDYVLFNLFSGKIVLVFASTTKLYAKSISYLQKQTFDWALGVIFLHRSQEL